MRMIEKTPVVSIGVFILGKSCHEIGIGEMQMIEEITGLTAETQCYCKKAQRCLAALRLSG